MPIYESVGKDRIYQLLMTTQIKKDCITLIALSDLIAQPILALAFLPIYALFAEEIENTIGEKGEGHRDRFIVPVPALSLQGLYV